MALLTFGWKGFSFDRPADGAPVTLKAEVRRNRIRIVDPPLWVAWNHAKSGLRKLIKSSGIALVGASLVMCLVGVGTLAIATRSISTAIQAVQMSVAAALRVDV